MLRSFRPQDFIQLPPLSEAGTLTLIDELEAAAKAAPKLPSAVYTSLGRVLEVSADLKKSIAQREKSGSDADPRARAADRALDDAWGALQSWLLGWTKLPDRAHEKVIEARGLYKMLFPKGLQFLTLDFKNEWKESQERLDVIASQRQDDLFAALGGAAFLNTIARAHRAYGDALHITGASTEPDSLVRKSLDTIHMALREYVAQVAATVRRTENDTVDLAAQLLAPLSARSLTEPEAVDMDDSVQSLYD